ncbi:MAG: holo-ACP synthase [bacterium]
MLVGLGIDVVEVKRIQRILKTFRGRFKERVFTAEEIAYCQSQGRPSLAFAARWAAKEACLKALGTGWTAGIGFKEIAVGHLESGAPTLILTGVAAEKLVALGHPIAHVSLTHTRTTAAAVVVLDR